MDTEIRQEHSLLKKDAIMKSNTLYINIKEIITMKHVVSTISVLRSQEPDFWDNILFNTI